MFFIISFICCFLCCHLFRLPTPEDLNFNLFMTDTAQNPDEQSQNENEDLYEGDIKLSEGDEAMLRSGLLGRQWDYHIIPYQIDWRAVKNAYKPWVQAKLDYVFNFEYKYKLGDCFQFCERTKECPKLKEKYNTNAYLSLQFGRGGCWSGVGMSGRKQALNLQFPSCIGRKGTIAHELMHALGFFHEQSRPDRGDYVVVMMANVKGSRKNNFLKMENTKPYDHYDFNSVMHYGEYAFRNKEWGGMSAQFTRTIYPSPLSISAIAMQLKNYGRGVKMGQRIGLSFCDELKLRRFYSEPGIKGNKKCQLWTERTCLCKNYQGTNPAGYDQARCDQFNLTQRTVEEFPDN